METYFKKKFKTHNMLQMEDWYLGVGCFLFFKRPCRAFRLINVWFAPNFVEIDLLILRGDDS